MSDIGPSSRRHPGRRSLSLAGRTRKPRAPSIGTPVATPRRRGAVEGRPAGAGSRPGPRRGRHMKSNTRRKESEGAAATGEGKATDLLRSDHEMVRGLFQRFRKAKEDAREKARLQREIDLEVS